MGLEGGNAYGARRRFEIAKFQQHRTREPINWSVEKCRRKGRRRPNPATSE